MNNKLFIIMLALLSSCAYASTSYNYWQEDNTSLYTKINLTSGYQYNLTITSDHSYTPNGSKVFSLFDDFTGSCSNWTYSIGGCASGTGQLVLSGEVWLRSIITYGAINSSLGTSFVYKGFSTGSAWHLYGFDPANTNVFAVALYGLGNRWFLDGVSSGCNDLWSSTVETVELFMNGTTGNNAQVIVNNNTVCTGTRGTIGSNVGFYNYPGVNTNISYAYVKRRSVYEPIVNVSGSYPEFNVTVYSNQTLTDYPLRITGINFSSSVNVTDGIPAFTIYGYDNITNRSLSVFNATIQWNGTTVTYTTTNGIITTNITRANELSNITIFSNGYTNYTLINHSVNANINAFIQPNQLEVSFNVTELITGNTITNYTVHFSTGENVSGINPTINMSVGTYNITFLNSSYFNKTIYGVSITSNTTVNFSGVYQYLINVSVRNSYNNSNESTFTAILNSTLYNFSNTSTTTNGTILFPWINDTTVYVNITNASTVGDVNTQVTSLTTYKLLSIVNLTANSSTINSLLFYIYDETNNSLINGPSVNLYLTGSATSYNYTTITGIVNATLIYPQTYLITYSSPAYNTRNYAFTLVNGSSTTILLYLRPTGNSSVVLITLTDQNQRTVVNATVYSRIKNLSNNQYYISEMCLTDNNGQCQISADVSTTTYRASTIYNFLVYYNGIVVGTSGDTVLSGNSYAMQVNIGTNALANSYSFANIVYSNITYNNVTQLYNVTYFDPTSIISNACLNAYRQIGAYTTLVNSTCSTLFTNTLSIGSNNSIGDADYAQFVIYFNGNIYLLTTSPTTKNNSSGSNFSPYFLIFVFIGVLITIFLGTKSLATTSIVMMAGVAFILIRISTTILPITAAIGLLVMAVVVYFRLKE